MDGQHPFDAFEQALNDERKALLAHDADGLLGACQAKLDALQLIEATDLRPEHLERFAAIKALNQSNSALLTRCRRGVLETLKSLGLADGAGTYRADGSRHVKQSLRYFGTG